MRASVLVRDRVQQSRTGDSTPSRLVLGNDFGTLAGRGERFRLVAQAATWSRLLLRLASCPEQKHRSSRRRPTSPGLCWWFVKAAATNAADRAWSSSKAGTRSPSALASALICRPTADCQDRTNAGFGVALKRRRTMPSNARRSAPVSLQSGSLGPAAGSLQLLLTSETDGPLFCIRAAKQSWRSGHAGLSQLVQLASVLLRS
jgi:hypothetical protein